MFSVVSVHVVSTHEGFGPASFKPTITSAAAVTENVTVGLPVNVFESLAVRIHAMPVIDEGTVVNVNVRSPYTVPPACRFAWIDQSAAFAVSFAESVVMRLPAG